MSIQALHQAVQSINAPDAFRPRLSMDQWWFFQSFLTRHTLASGHMLLRQGERERTMYLVESGSLQVYLDKPLPGQRLSVLRAGAIVGEAGLFSDQPRMANAETNGTSVVWSLTGQRYEELAARNPPLTLEVVRAAAAVMAVRMRDNVALRHAVC